MKISNRKMSAMKSKVKGLASLLLCTVIWGSAFISQSIGMDHIGPFTFQAVRCFLAVIALIPVIIIADRFKKDNSTFLKRWADKSLWKAGILCGIPLFIACNLQQLGIAEDTDPGKSAFLTAMYIVLVPIIGIFQGKKPTRWIPICVILAVAGLYCLSCVGVTSVSPGDLLLLGCALAFAFQIILIEKYASSVDALRLNAIQALICAVLSLFVMLLTEKPTVSSIMACAIPLLHAGVFSMAIAYSLQIIGQKYLESTASSLIMSLESVFAVLFGWLIMDKTLTQWETVGCILMFIAVILSQLPGKASKLSS